MKGGVPIEKGRSVGSKEEANLKPLTLLDSLTMLFG